MPETFDLKVRLVPDGVERFAKKTAGEIDRALSPMARRIARMFGERPAVGFEAGFRKTTGVGQLSKEMQDALKRGGLSVALGKIVGIASKAGAVVTAIKMGVDNMVGMLSGVSPALGALLELTKKIFGLVLKPIGDFVAMLLRPFIVLALKYLVLPFYKWMMSLQQQEKGAVGGAVAGALAGGAVAGLAGAAVGGAIGAVAGEVLSGMDTEQAKSAVQGVLDWFASTFSGLLDGLKSAWETVRPAIEALMPLLGVIAGVVGSVLTGILSFFSDYLGGFIEMLAGGFTTIVGLLTGNMDLVKKGASAMMEGNRKMLDSLLNLLRGVWEGLKSAYNEIVAPAISRVRNWLSSLIEAVRGLIREIRDSIASLVSKIPVVGGGLARAIRGYQYGGLVPETGLYLLHAGEKVVPAYKPEKRAVTANINISVNANVRDDRDIDEIARRVRLAIANEMERWDRW